MIVKAEIQSVDFSSNTCVVRLPFFETSSINEPALATATISNTPGVYNGYQPGDVCFVAFDEGLLTAPTVIGKLFLGSSNEKANPRGTANFEALEVSQRAVLPLDTRIATDFRNDIVDDNGGYAKFQKLSDILDAVRTHENKIANAELDIKKTKKAFVQDSAPVGDISDGDT